MRFRNTTRGLVKYLRPTIRHDLERLVRAGVSNPNARPFMNAVYRRLSLSQQAALHERFARVFRETSPDAGSAHWNVRFCGRELQIPLRKDHLWLDWDTALSVLGHESEIKATYAFLLASAVRPKVFLDVGANYGTHSLLFLAHGIRTLSFEPNLECHELFRLLCAANSVEPRIEPVALGDRAADVDLNYVSGETWLGTTNGAVAVKMLSRSGLQTRRVRQRMLDEYLPELPAGRMLLKIDTEGNELAVLRGGRRLLTERRPIVLFESWPHSSRRELFELFDAGRYRIGSLPLDDDSIGRALTVETFLVNHAANFVAVPGENRAAAVVN